VTVEYDGSVTGIFLSFFFSFFPSLLSGAVPSFDGFSVRGRCEGQWKSGVQIQVGEFRTESDTSGAWQLENIPSGQHTVRASLSRQGRAYQLEPSAVEVTIATEDVELSTAFKVDKFVVQGSVPSGLTGVTVVVDATPRPEIKIDASGHFLLPVSEGSRLTVSAQKQGVVFATVTFDGSQMSVIPALAVESYLSCFEFEGLANTQASVTVGPHQQVLVGTTPVCLALPPGQHTVAVDNVKVHPVAPLVVAATPPPTTRIRQVLYQLQGQVQLIAGFGSSNIQITLDNGQTAPLQADHSFQFDQLVTAEHTVSIQDDVLCFAQSSLAGVAGTPLIFTQTGLRFTQVCHPEAPRAFRVAGERVSYECPSSGLCLPVSSNAPLLIYPQGPVVFHPASVSLTAQSVGQPLRFEPVASRVTGTLTGAGRLTVVAEGEERAVEVEDHRFEVEVPLRKTFFLRCTPLDAAQLCYPREITSPSAAYDFEVRSGQFKTGSVQPAVAGVKMTVQCEAEEYVAETTADGSFKIGPIRGEKCGKVKGEHADYAVQAPAEAEGQIFQLHPLSSLTVSVLDTANRPVPECVLSLSGEGNFRRNELTGADGSFKFLSVPPGTYYVRALLKEYTFEPSHQSVTLSSSPQTISFAATRIAFSVYGSVMGLTQEPEKAVSVVAKQGGKILAEAKTDEKGLFRLRGLTPGQTYQVQPEDPRLERAAPLAAAVTMEADDTTGIEFVALRQTQKLEVICFHFFFQLFQIL
jgi:protocatechuate 3,4-dioxygenase beta subunit